MKKPSSPLRRPAARPPSTLHERVKAPEAVHPALAEVRQAQQEAKDFNWNAVISRLATIAKLLDGK